MDEIERIEDSKNEQEDHSEKGFSIKESKYFAIETRGKSKEKIELSNFVGKSEFHLIDGTNNTKRIILIQRKKGEIYYHHLIEVRSSEMKLEPFETILKSKQCTFYGNSYHLKKIFTYWMDNETQAIFIETLGYSREHDIYAFSNGIFSKFGKFTKTNDAGIIEGDKNFYIPSFGLANINNPDYDQERKFQYIQGKLNFESWSLLYYDAFKSNGGIGILFLIISIFWDIILDEVGFFPFLFLFGAFGTGKTKLVEYLLRVFGNDYKGISLGQSSSIGLARTIASRNNGIFYLKEYTPETDLENQDLLLCAYDGSGRATGIKTNDNKTRVSLVRSAFILDGNNLPTAKTAVLSRMILLNADVNKYEPGQIKAFNQLEENQNEGFGCVFSDIYTCREYFKSNFKRIFFEEVGELRKSLDADFAERTLKHVALILTPVKMLKDQLKMPFTYSEIKEAVVNNAIDQNILLKETDEITIFWNAFAYLIKNHSLVEFKRIGNEDNHKESHYNIKEDGSAETILQIKPKQIFPDYVKYCKNNGIRFLDYNSLLKLLTSKSNNHFVQPDSQGDRCRSYTDAYFKSCYQFRIEKIGNSIKIQNVDIDL